MKIYKYTNWFKEIEIAELECEEKTKTYKAGKEIIKKDEIDKLCSFNRMYSFSKDNLELYKKLLIEDYNKEIERLKKQISNYENIIESIKISGGK